MTHEVITTWEGNMKFHSTNPAGELYIDVAPEDGGDGEGLRPKALMLSALAGCSGLDVASLMKKMKLEVDEFFIKTVAELTEEHPKYYHTVTIEYHFKGRNLDEKIATSCRFVNREILWCHGDVSSICKVKHRNALPSFIKNDRHSLDFKVQS